MLIDRAHHEGVAAAGSRQIDEQEQARHDTSGLKIEDTVCCVVSQQPGAALEWGVLTLGAISQEWQSLTRPTQIATLLCAGIHPSLSFAAQQPWCPPATFSPSLPYHTCSTTTL